MQRNRNVDLSAWPARTAGVDEAGRGPLAGAVFAAAVILDPARPIQGLADSKVLSARKRDSLYGQITERALTYCVAHASVAEIDALNILQATLLAMRRAVEGLSIAAEGALIDGTQVPHFAPAIRCSAIIDGDALIPQISAASILAKCARDADLVVLDARYPGYGFAQHKGYGTRQHMEALSRLGPCPAHRTSFAPVRQAALQFG